MAATPAARLLSALCLTAALAGAAVAQPPAAAPSVGAAAGAVFSDPDGQRYTIRKLAKKDLRYRLRPDGTVRVLPYFQYRLAGEDDDYLYVKEYLAQDVAPAPAAPPAQTGPPTPAEMATTGAIDRLTFIPFDQGLPAQGQWRNGFDLADMNGDGQIDIVHGPPRKGGGGPRIFLGDGAGHWRLWREASYPKMPYDYGTVAAADFDSDGKLDLALAAHLRGISVLLGDGQGGFRLAATPADLEPDAANRFTTRTLLARDWNGDGKPDLVAIGEGPRPGGAASATSAYGWVVYLNQGAGRWQKLAQANDSPRTFGDALVVADFDGDGLNDLLTGSNAFGNTYVLHYGEAGGQAHTVKLDAIPQRVFIQAVAAADFDGAGRADLALGYGESMADGWQVHIDVLGQRSDGGWRRTVLYRAAGRDFIYALAAGDVDGDGKPDLAALDDAGAIRLFLGDGKGGFDQEQTPRIAAARSGLSRLRCTPRRPRRRRSRRTGRRIRQ
ncbi:MAG: VCBS repeat-containing protein [Gammaproteobacteria bacterium]